MHQIVFEDLSKTNATNPDLNNFNYHEEYFLHMRELVIVNAVLDANFQLLLHLMFGN